MHNTAFLFFIFFKDPCRQGLFYVYVKLSNNIPILKKIVFSKMYCVCEGYTTTTKFATRAVDFKKVHHYTLFTLSGCALVPLWFILHRYRLYIIYYKL